MLHVCQTNMGSGMKSALRLVSWLGLFLALSSCSHRSESELETIALSLAVDEAKEYGASYHWPRDRYPLTVGFFAGAGLDGTGCISSWRREFERYVHFMNAGRQPLLRLSSSPETDFDALVYYGSFDEFKVSPAYNRFRTWKAKPGISELWTHKDHPFLSSASAALGSDPMVRFGIRYVDLEPLNIKAMKGCSSTAQPSADLAEALLQRISFSIAIEIRRRYPEPEQSLGWRAYRRFLSATRLLPPHKLEREEKRAAMVKALFSE